ncbi:hypothetical protein GC105_08155 [Alkalibaculum sp. M08DMB]|uniref:Uncharacterized protein n=1 Tax=Alkalibaculum sporogenes TaxID=2655001 RepID=A0A6A7K8V7_9FIRM|nr:hypothetical protein [Alkalibaculum sporogenes]MPW25761.1 hypothetical protein [Alkalibaculum sporogenes]
MDDFNKINIPNDVNHKDKSSAEEFKNLIKSIAILETKSGIAKLKLAKLVIVKGSNTIKKNAIKLSEFVEKSKQENKNTKT